ncbi:hypothetical protein BegalDRAFT_2561 [Beggiatoa alba B18LD]|uniref:Uncharacterized protein n=1 Tax=Beggiatoa alba B18LD TaxID=395493 RepID=I3CIG1_9GAMM|nr:hypothetical protein [Beggiatoa alba]EIJ43404.1 hypothetical protein BegalDRAFT_2561 [Beggiatoa alba B18LD]
MSRTISQILLIFCFIFAPSYFINQLIFNALQLTTPLLWLASSSVISFFIYQRYQGNIFPYLTEINTIPVFIHWVLFFITLILISITLVVGIDDSSDAYFYHLNIATPISLFQNLFEYSYYDLDSYSQGYPKYANFLQAFAMTGTGYFWAYGLISVLVIPCSFWIVYSLARQLTLSVSAAAWVGLIYALNPINIAQATTGYIDTIQSLYILALITLALRPATKLHLTLFLLNLIVLVNIKFTGILLGAGLFGFYSVLHWRFFWTQWRIAGIFIGVAGSIALLHYLHNWFTFGTLVFPFIDSAFAKVIAELYIKPETYSHRFITLFWTVPESLSVLAVYDTVHGAFSFLWYPFPFFIFLALVKTGLRREFKLFAVFSIFCLLLALDPVVSIGRYVAYFQCAGFLALAYLLPTRYARGLIVVAMSYLLLTGYILLNPETGHIARRSAYAEQRQAFLNSIQSQRRQAFDFYYNINAACAGYYWLMRFYQVPVKLVENPPNEGNFFYIHRPTYQQHCEVITHYQADIGAKLTQTAQGQTLLILSAKNPAAQENCQLCISEYGCLYLPFHIYTMTINLSQVFQFKMAGEKNLTLTCRAIDGKVLEKSLQWHVNSGN